MSRAKGDGEDRKPDLFKDPSQAKGKPITSQSPTKFKVSLRESLESLPFV